MVCLVFLTKKSKMSFFVGTFHMNERWTSCHVCEIVNPKKRSKLVLRTGIYNLCQCIHRMSLSSSSSYISVKSSRYSCLHLWPCIHEFWLLRIPILCIETIYVHIQIQYTISYKILIHHHVTTYMYVSKNIMFTFVWSIKNAWVQLMTS